VQINVSRIDAHIIRPRPHFGSREDILINEGLKMAPGHAAFPSCHQSKAMDRSVGAWREMRRPSCVGVPERLSTRPLLSAMPGDTWCRVAPSAYGRCSVDQKLAQTHSKFLRLHFQPFGSTPTTLSPAER